MPPSLEGLWEKVLDAQACCAVSFLTSAALTVPGDILAMHSWEDPRPYVLGLLLPHEGTWPTAWFPPDARVCPRADPPLGCWAPEVTWAVRRALRRTEWV